MENMNKIINEGIMERSYKVGIKEIHGDNRRLASDHINPRVLATGDTSDAAAAGYYNEAYAFGDGCNVATAGDCGHIATTGRYPKVAMAGDCGHIITTGERARIAAAGDARVTTYGDSSCVSTGSGTVRMLGKNNIGACLSGNGVIKGNLGDWVILAEWGYNEKGEYVPLCVKSAQIDGETLRPDTWYTMEGGEIVKLEEWNVQWWDIAEGNV